MSNNLFPLRVYSIFSAMKDAGLIKSMQLCENTKQPSTSTVQAPDDGLVRLMLNSPTVQRQVREETGARDFRIRIALPERFDFMSLVSNVKLEIYAISGEPLREPVLLTELENEMGNAVQVELLDRLLQAKGTDLTRM